MHTNVTLKDIAAAMNISRTTVHRALHGKEGVAEELRLQICARAAQMGYQANYVASSLKRKTMRLAVVLPHKEETGRFYHKYFWDAIDDFLPEASSLNVIIERIYFSENDNSQLTALQTLLDQELAVDGLLTMIANSDDNMRNMIEKFSYRNIPVVLLDNDLPGVKRLCCVAPHDQLIGRLGAEFLSSITKQAGSVLIAGGNPDNTAHQFNLSGFTQYLNQNNCPLTPIVIHEYGQHKALYDHARKLLEETPDIVAFYSVTARDTIPLAEAVYDSGKAGLLSGVGSDLYPQSADLLRQNVVQALIYKNAFDKGHLGFRILFDFVVKNLSPRNEQVMVPIGLILKNNLPFFEQYL